MQFCFVYRRHGGIMVMWAEEIERNWYLVVFRPIDKRKLVDKIG
jgi:hypothetical protein